MNINESIEFYENGKIKVTVIEPENYQYGINYAFDVGYAQKYGIDEAIFLQNIIFWLRQNKANNNNFNDGHYWTYNSQKAYTKLFPFWNESKIKRIIKSLVDQQVIIIGHYNENKYDHTNWYALKDERMLNNCLFDSTDLTKGIDKNIHSISQKRTFINTDINTDINTNINNIIIDKESDIKNDSVNSNKELITNILNYLNLKAKSDYRYNKTNINYIMPRINEKYSFEDFKKVIDIKTEQWLNDANMCMYLRPMTLFSNKFESYLNQKNTSKNKDYENEYLKTNKEYLDSLEQ